MKEVKYQSNDWLSLVQGVELMANATVFEYFQQADLLSQQAETLCESYDSDRAIDIETAKNPAYNELETRWHQLQRAMQPIPDTLSAGVDHPFDVAMDEFMEKLSNMNIMGYTTMARGAYSNGVNAVGVSKYKMKVGLGDILGSSSPLTDYLQVEYEEMRQKVGDVSFEEYQKMAFADTSFDYYSKSEQITGLAVTIIVNGTALAVGAMLPVPIMIALGLAGGVKNGYDALSGKDLITGKELSQGDRILRGLAGIADIGLAAYGTYKGIKAMKGTKGVVPKVEVDGFHGKTVKVEKVGRAGKTSKEVEIINKNGSPLGEFDEIDLNKGIFYEDKTAKGLDVVNPRTGLPTQTPQQFADKQIYQKTVNRIKNLDIAEATRPTVNGSQSIPSLQEIKGIKKFVFRLDGNSAELQSVVNQNIKKLQSEFPDYTFEVIFGGK
ncbi:pre-toxin TG domain-containing protein [Enterococcus rivorum]|uniref:pre-toxin TG domain-containing protein n=2 Tax=Enterococcus rivorum TaxID=762845 RepID=UPI001AEB18C7|nr:pre-toxin TG domain-containing protein [Enterococcus rivorum]MBP2098781.1 hypothetical protein [Enterococcus rivorum]